MRYLWSGFVSAFSLRLRSFRGWIIAVLLPLLTFCALGLLPAQEVSAPVRVGVCLPEEGGEEFWTLLQQRSGTVISFIESDGETIEKMVATSQWDCGLLLAEDFGACLAELDTDRMFTIQIGAGSTAYPLVREAVAACLAELIKTGIAEEYLLDSGIVSDEQMLEALQPALDEILPDSARVQVSMRTLDGAPLDALKLADDSVKDILRWMISAVLLVWLLLSTVDLGRWMETPTVRRMRGIQPDTVLMLSRIGADMVFAVAAGWMSLLLLGDGWPSCAAVLCYVVFWGMLAVLLGHIRPAWSALPVFMPFIPVGSLLLSSVIVDIGLFVPAAAKISGFLPVFLFLKACGGDSAGMLILLAMSCVCLLICALIDRK